MLQLDYNKIMETLLEQGMSVNVRASGISMFPLLWPGVELRIAKASSIERCDIVAFRRDDGRWIAHRVLAVGDKVECRGDSCVSADKPVGHEAVIGRVTHFIAFGVAVPLTGVLARTYGRVVMATHPFSARINNLMARVVVKLKKILS